MCTFFCQKLTTALLESAKGENGCRKYFMINLHERMLPTSAGVEHSTSLVHPIEPPRLAWPRFHRGKHSEQVSSKLGQNCDLLSVKLIVEDGRWTTMERGWSQYLTLCFCSGELKIDFQDGHHGGHLGFQIRTILANDLQVTLMLPTKFQVN